MAYSRASPSPRYLELLAQYRSMHEEGERFLGIAAEQTFSGISLQPYLADIKRLIRQTGAASILDYGSGKGALYTLPGIEAEGAHWEGVQDYWDVDYVWRYDPCFAPFRELPSDPCDGVVSTDVLEHCPEEDVPWILEEMFGYARRFVFLTVACHPARKRLPNGENAHCTIKPAAWWNALLAETSARHPGVLWEARLYAVPPGADQAVEQTLRGGT